MSNELRSSNFCEMVPIYEICKIIRQQKITQYSIHVYMVVALTQLLVQYDAHNIAGGKRDRESIRDLFVICHFYTFVLCMCLLNVDVTVMWVCPCLYRWLSAIPN